MKYINLAITQTDNLQAYLNKYIHYIAVNSIYLNGKLVYSILVPNELITFQKV